MGRRPHDFDNIDLTSVKRVYPRIYRSKSTGPFVRWMMADGKDRRSHFPDEETAAAWRDELMRRVADAQKAPAEPIDLDPIPRRDDGESSAKWWQDHLAEYANQLQQAVKDGHAGRVEMIAKACSAVTSLSKASAALRDMRELENTIKQLERRFEQLKRASASGQRLKVVKR